MRERFPDLAERLKTLVRRIMVETDPEEFDLKASEIWLTGEQGSVRVMNKPEGVFDDLDTVNVILGQIKQLEATVLGLQQLRSYIGNGVEAEILESLMTEAETKIAEVKGKLMQ